ncbi:TetR/AcrR family transcriptional regulator [Solihabitans fulvus]|uniref:TetR/AcrR family transcriptional regulator n=1 Tax=Solihabitans fulvus TaxID=1892852 RepID=UPI001CB75E3E|nr:TetR family transcriptional regulator [Solihabitans fulvus]
MPVTGDGDGLSVTSAARRAQIVAATIETIAELGYAQASFSRIAERAGLSSTRLISYHFAGKDDLIGAVVADVYSAIAQFMAERMAGQTDARGALRAYLSGVVEFIAGHPTQMRALMAVFLDFRAEDGGRSYDAASDRDALGHVQEILRAGQASGEFREFDTFVMAATIQRSVDGLPFLLQTKPDLDLRGYAEELVTLFDLATRSQG